MLSDEILILIDYQLGQLVIMKCKYRVRMFSSKGAFLVLFWTMLVAIIGTSLIYLIRSQPILQFQLSTPIKCMIFIPLALVALVLVPVSGWLADAKFGNYKTFRAGIILLFIATVTYCLFQILEALDKVWESNTALKWIILSLAFSTLLIGGCLCSATALPLGLDQMPDASSSSIASYIAWFVCAISVGKTLSQGLNEVVMNCVTENANKISYYLIWGLLLSVCMSIVLASDFL